VTAGLVGADVQQLRDLANQFDRGAQDLQSAAATVTRGVQAQFWTGPIALRFKVVWDTQHSLRLKVAATALREAANSLRLNADEQDTVSHNSTDSLSRAPGKDGPRDYSGVPNRGDHGSRAVPDNLTITKDTVQPGDVHQQQVGDCWLAAALAAVAGQRPEFIADHILHNSDGTWTVILYDDEGKAVPITLKPQVAGNGMDDGNNPNWASLYEEAFAVYMGNDYSKLGSNNSAYAFRVITGQAGQQTGEGSFSAIEEALRQGPVTVGTEDGYQQKFLFWSVGDGIDNKAICPDHSYYVKGFETNSKGEQVIVLGNPWGEPGTHAGHDISVELRLTEQEYKENFDSVNAVAWRGAYRGRDL
jgi:hypothetical protein